MLEFTLFDLGHICQMDKSPVDSYFAAGLVR